jgi:hypothetical protein
LWAHIPGNRSEHRKGKLTNHLFRDVATRLHSSSPQSIKVCFFVVLHLLFSYLMLERLDTRRDRSIDEE